MIDFNIVDEFEKIDLSHISQISDWVDLSDPLTGHLRQAGGDVIIDNGFALTIRIADIDITTLAEANFIF